MALLNVFQDPAKPYQDWDGQGWTLQIHAPLPDPVPVGHHEEGGIEVIDETISRTDYLERVQRACATHGAAYTVRFYDHFEEPFDASIVAAFDEVRTLTIDTHSEILNPEAVGRLPKLEALSLAPSGKPPPDLLDRMGIQRLERFTLGETSTPPIDLSPLGEAQSLRSLRLLARGKNTEAVGNCGALIELSMHPTTKIDLGFINRLQTLEVLKFSLGGVPSIEAIGSLPNLQDLSFDNVNLLEELGDLQRFPKLRRLQISYQKRLKRVRVGPANAALEHINVDGIDEIIGLSQLPALKSFNNFAGKFSPDWSEIPASVTHFAVWPTSLKKREKHNEEVRAHGLIPELHPDAQFFYK